MLRSALLALVLTLPAPVPTPVCQPAPSVVQTPTTPANSTYVNDGEPPQRFRFPPKQPLTIAFGQANIDAICGVPPCGTYFEGCTHGNVIVLPDPWSPNFARIARHELAHVNGWPATHGD